MIAGYKQELAKNPPALATRNASQNALDVINAAVPETVGGSADLTGSNNTKSKELKPFNAADYGGRYVYYGIREHGMAAAMNGMALHGGVIPYGGTFLVFTDYCRPSIRLSALMQQRVIYVMTHDSIGLGEDGPTHQPVEHLAAMRVIPNLAVYRPCDAVETAECWQLALKDETRPSILALTRQKLKPARIAYSEENLCARGAYEIAPSDKPAAGRDLRLGLRSGNRDCRQGAARRGGQARARRLGAVDGEFRARRMPPTRRRCWAPRRRASPSRPACAPAGTASSASTEPSSA